MTTRLQAQTVDITLCPDLNQLPPYLRRRSLARCLGIGLSTLDSYIKGDRTFPNGKSFPKGVRVNGVRIFEVAEIKAFLASIEERA